MEGVNRIKKMVNLNEYLNTFDSSPSHESGKLYRCKHLGNLVDLHIDDRDDIIII